ncbi:MAG: hypothetical protein O7B99_11775, partial [Planctomycetota bacterium]|nr:hypothetical protein [Planctomycetota bacterium]
AVGDSPGALAAALRGADARRGRVDARAARDASAARAADLDAAPLAERFVAGARVDWSGAPGRRMAGLPTYPFQRRRHWVETTSVPVASARVTVASAPGQATPTTLAGEAELRELVLNAIAAVSGRAREDIRPEHELGADLGFDSLQTIALDRRLRQLLAGLKDGEQPFDEETTVAGLIALLEEARVASAPPVPFDDAGRPAAGAPLPTGAKRWATYAELIGMDPGETYVGGAFRNETHRLHALRAKGVTIAGLLDVENKYAGTAGFHLTQMGAYAFVVQMIQGYLCYKHGVGKDQLGMPTLDAIDMRWERMVRTSKDIPGRIEETRARLEGGRWVLEFDFDVGDGAVTGRLIGRMRVDAPERPLAERGAREYGEFAELLGKDPAETYTGGTFQGESQSIYDVEASGPTIAGLLDVENEFSGTPHFHLTQMGTYSAVVQLLLGYLCYRFDVPKERLGMPVLKSFEILWKRMITQPTGIRLCVTEESCALEGERYLMRMSFDVGDGSAVGTLEGVIPKP